MFPRDGQFAVSENPAETEDRDSAGCQWIKRSIPNRRDDSLEKV
jgi:hypothetical protein